MSIIDDIRDGIKGDITDDGAVRAQASRDTSIFERTPSLVVFPKDADDVVHVVTAVRAAKKRGEQVALAARSAGTDMTGGSLTDSVSMITTKYMNHIGEIGDDYVDVEPGVYYRDLEAATLAKTGMLFPSYPASRELCAVGGIVSNNSGGELSLRYGKTNQHVRSLDVVLSDGSRVTLRPLRTSELAEKEQQHDFEGEIYRRMHDLIENNYDDIQAARPNVSKNSAGYALWNVYDKKTGVFDLTQLVVGSQGTLTMVTNARLGLVRTRPHHTMLVIFLSDFELLPDIVNRVLKYEPETFESYDDHTFSLAVKFLPDLFARMGFDNIVKLGLSFLPEVWMAATGGIPKLVLMAEFAEESRFEADSKAEQARAALYGLPVKTKIARGHLQTAKYWTIRREAFAVLRKNSKDLYAAPFIDDFVVRPETYPGFIPELAILLNSYGFTYAITGHIGDGNFHIFPLLNLKKEADRKVILELQPKVYTLVTKYGGTTTGEHNDGIIRTPYIPMVFSPLMCQLFAETKNIWDPDNIFNPGKKVGGTTADIEKYMIR